jgi:transposase
MAKWLRERNVRSVAMESTGVYWIAPHEVLEAEGLEVLLVDRRAIPRQSSEKPYRNSQGIWLSPCARYHMRLAYPGKSQGSRITALPRRDREGVSFTTGCWPQLPCSSTK